MTPFPPCLTVACDIIALCVSRGAIEHGIYFGIKASGNYAGKRTLQKTRENFGNREAEVTDNFRAYDDWWSSFRDYGELIGKAKRYARARQSKNNPGNYLKEIKAAGYATDTNYVEKVKKIVNARADILGGPI